MPAMSLMQAYDLGEGAARNIKIGDVFYGAVGACRAAGIPTDSVQGWFFRSGFLDNLPRLVVTDADNRVLGGLNDVEADRQRARADRAGL